MFTKNRLRSSQGKAILAFNVAPRCQACWSEKTRSLVHYILRHPNIKWPLLNPKLADKNQMETNLSSDSRQLVFVYGTLKRGHQRNHVFANQTFVGPATTAANYRMYDLGDYPGLIEVEPGSGDRIQGEIYQVDPTCLLQLDRIEAVDQGLYERRDIRLNPPLEAIGGHLKPFAGTIVAYFYLGDIEGDADCRLCW